MQTFLPHSSFVKSLRSLDNARLGKQRVETLQILNVLTGNRIEGVWLDDRKKVAAPRSEWWLSPSAKGWGNHPMTNMWAGHELALLRYGLINCRVWVSERGCADTCAAKLRFLFPDVGMAEINAAPAPSWLGLDELHLSHQVNLVDKAKQYYLHHADKPHRPHGSGSRGCDGDTPHKPHRNCQPKLMWQHYRPQFPDVAVSGSTAPVAMQYVWPVPKKVA